MKRIITTFAALALLTAPGLSQAASPTGEPVKFSIIAQQPGTSFFTYATSIVRLLDEQLPKGSKVDVMPRGGSVANPTMLNEHKADMAMALGCTAAWAMQGNKSVYPDYGKHDNIRGITGGMHMSHTFVLARKDYVEKTGAKTLDDLLKGKELPRFAMKPAGSVVIPIVDTMLAEYGTDLNALRAAGKLTQAQPSQISEHLRDGRVDVYIDNVPLNHAGVTELTLTNDMVFIPLPDKAIAALDKVGMARQMVPAGSYKGLAQDYPTSSTGMVIMAHKDAPENAVYAMARTLAERKDDLAKENPALADWNPEEGAKPENAVLPLHPGAAKYYKERGWIK